MNRFVLPLAAVVLALTAPASAAPLPGSILSAPGRSEAALAADAGRQPLKVMDYWGVKKSERVLDMMAGAGYYSELLARVVGPKGSVVAFVNSPGPLDDQPKIAEHWTALQKRNPNVRLQKGSVTAPPFAPGSFDKILLHLEYHDFYWVSEKYHYPRVEPREVLARLYAALKPGGTILLVDHIANAGGDTRETVDKLHRIDPEVARADFLAAGFVLDGESDLLKHSDDDHTKLVFDMPRGTTDRFMMRFRKPG